MIDRACKEHAGFHPFAHRQRAQPRLVSALADQHQPRAGDIVQGGDRDALTLALDQRSDAGDERGIVGKGEAEFARQLAAQLRVFERAEAVTVEPGVMHRDLACIHSHHRHLACQIMADREQAGGGLGGVHHLLAGKALFAPEADIAPPRLDRQRQAHRFGDDRGGRAIGEEELRVDQIDRGFGMDDLHQRQCSAGNGGRIAARADARDQGEMRAVDGDPALGACRRQIGQRTVAPQGERWEADRIDQRHPPVPALGQRLHRTRHEGPEARIDRVGIERREAEDVFHIALPAPARVKAA